VLDRLLVSKPLIGIQIPLIEQQNSLRKLEEAAGSRNLPLWVWSALSPGFHGLRDVPQWQPSIEDPGNEILAVLQSQALTESGVYVYLDLFTAIAALPPAQQVQADLSITALFFALSQSSVIRMVFLETGEIPSKFIQLIHNYNFPLPTAAEITQIRNYSGLKN
jgi:hypothetical protein